MRLRTTAPAADGRAAIDDRLVQDDRAAADSARSWIDAAFEVGEVANDAVVADHGGILGDRVHHRAVLDRRALAHDDRAVVAAQHGARPDRGVARRSRTSPMTTASGCTKASGWMVGTRSPRA